MNAGENRRLAIWPWGAVLLIALTFPTLITWVYFYAMAGSEAVRWIYSGSKVLQFSLLIPWYLHCRRNAAPSSSQHAAWRRAKGIQAGVVFALGVVAIGVALYVGMLRDSAVMTPAAAQIRGKLTDMGAASPLGYLGLSVFLAGIHSLLEEGYWRWFVYGGLRQMIPVPLANGISSLGFMAHHVLVLAAFFPGQWTWIALFSLAVAVGGAAWAWLYQRTDSLLGPWVSHLIVDAGILAIGYDLAFRP